MRKTFQLTATNKKPERQVEAVKSEIKKYIARERRKKVPEGADFWDFDCKIGPSEQDNAVIVISEIRSNIDKLVSEDNQSFYIEILARKGVKPPKAPASETDVKDANHSDEDDSNEEPAE